MADSIRSYGGVAGEVAVTEDLERGARIISSASALMAAAGRELGEAAGYTGTARRNGSETTRRAATNASNALWDARHAGGGTVATVNSAQDLADRLLLVAKGFLEAEQGAMSHVSALSRMSRAVGALWGTGIWTVRHGVAGALVTVAPPLSLSSSGRQVVGAIRPDGLPPTTGFLNRDSVQLLLSGMDSSVVGYAAQVYALAAVLATLEGLFGEGHASTVKERSQSYAARAPRSLADVMDGIQAEENRMDGSVAIETITHADGSRSHIVTIPGTEDWGVSNDNPHDAQGNLPGVLGKASDAQMAIVDAMRAAGINPGEEVMLAGHSQGGINAVALASRAEFLDEFNVTHVVTAGSPVGRIELPASVEVLQLEHTEDLVAGLDAVPSPDTPTRTTVERDLTWSGDVAMQQLGQDVAGAHHLSGYASTAALVDAGRAGTSATAWRESASGFLSGETSSLTEYVPIVPESTASEPTGSIPRPSPGPAPTAPTGSANY